MKNLSKFKDNFVNGLQAKPSTKPPSDQAHADLLAEKLAKLNQEITTYTDPIIDDLHRVEPHEKISPDVPSRAKFARLIQTANSSGAVDYHDLALKQTKIIFAYNATLLDALYDIFCEIAKSGEMAAYHHRPEPR